MRRTILTLIAILILGFIVFSVYRTPTPSSPTLSIGNKNISLIVVDTPSAREHGLSDSESLPDDVGMLFVFDKPDMYKFWMKDMKFPLDIVWLDQNYEIVDIKENLSPESYPETFSPSRESLYVIEFNAGFAEKNGLKIGNILNIHLLK